MEKFSFTRKGSFGCVSLWLKFPFYAWNDSGNDKFMQILNDFS